MALPPGRSRFWATCGVTFKFLHSAAKSAVSYALSPPTVNATGGWLARFLWVAVPDPNRAIHKVPLGDAALETRLKNKLVRISKLKGQADTTAIYTDDLECAYAKWYMKTRARWKRQGPLGEIFWGRWRASVLKLAIVFEISRTESLKASVESFNRAAWPA
jgi:hypothetical protein